MLVWSAPLPATAPRPERARADRRTSRRAAIVVHEATAIWNVRYANATRAVPPVEQHIHGVLQALPFIALLLLTVLHWDDPADRYLAGVLAGALGFGALPYS